jgi:hypothetical protein
MKGKIGKIVLACIILIVLVLSFIYMKDSVTIEPISKILDVAKDIEIDGKYLKVTYSSGNMIDEKISYNNTLEKNIKVVNYNNSIISYALELYDSSVSNEELYYKIEASNEKGGKYYTVVDNQKVKGDQALAYNLAIDPNSSIYLKVTFNSQSQGNPIELKGILNIKSNLTEKDIFIREVSNVDSELQLKIAELNGIGVSGIYILSLDDLKVDNGIKGYILINAEDLSNIEYYYYVYSEKYMLKDFNYVGSISKNAILDIDPGFVSSLNNHSVCQMRGKKNCLSFNDLTYNTSGGKKEFDTDAKKVIELVKSDFKGSEKKVYIYDVTTDINNPTNIRGFVLIDNTKEEKEYYIYLTNNVFMISGYNMTKYGEFSPESTTIRAYTESAFNLSSANARIVCSFSGFNDCINKEGSTI